MEAPRRLAYERRKLFKLFTQWKLHTLSDPTIFHQRLGLDSEPLLAPRSAGSLRSPLSGGPDCLANPPVKNRSFFCHGGACGKSGNKVLARELISARYNYHVFFPSSAPCPRHFFTHA